MTREKCYGAKMASQTACRLVWLAVVNVGWYIGQAVLIIVRLRYRVRLPGIPIRLLSLWEEARFLLVA